VLSRLAERISDHPRRYLVAAFVFLVVAIGVGTPVTGLLSAGNADDFVAPGAESTVASADLERRLGRQTASYELQATTGALRTLNRPGSDGDRRGWIQAAMVA